MSNILKGQCHEIFDVPFRAGGVLAGGGVAGLGVVRLQPGVKCQALVVVLVSWKKRKIESRSVVDPDPVGSGTFSWVRIPKIERADKLKFYL